MHTEVNTTSPALTQNIVSYLSERICQLVLESFTKRLENPGDARPSFTLPALLQATLDVEFITQVLGTQYTSSKAQEYQRAVYQVLDKGSSDEARAGLQGELVGVKNVLHNERKATRSEL